MKSPDNSWVNTDRSIPKAEESSREGYKGTSMYQFFEKDSKNALDVLGGVFASGAIDSTEDYFFADTDESKWAEMIIVLNDLDKALKNPGAKKNELRKGAGLKLVEIRDRE